MSIVDEAFLAAYLDGELSKQEQKLVEASLSNNSEVQAILVRLRQENDLVKQALDKLIASSSSTSLSISETLKQLKIPLANKETLKINLFGYYIVQLSPFLICLSTQISVYYATW